MKGTFSKILPINSKQNKKVCFYAMFLSDKFTANLVRTNAIIYHKEDLREENKCKSFPYQTKFESN